MKNYTDSGLLHLLLKMLDSHTCGQLVGPADQDVAVGRLRAPLHGVGVQLRVKHMQRSRTGASTHDCSAPARSLENTNIVYIKVYHAAQIRQWTRSLALLLILSNDETVNNQVLMNSELTLHVNVYQSFKTHQLKLLRRLMTSDVITYRSLTGTN